MRFGSPSQTKPLSTRAAERQNAQGFADIAQAGRERTKIFAADFLGKDIPYTNPMLL
jgi:hypothetical protein